MRYYSEETVREMMDRVHAHVRLNVPCIDEFPDVDLQWHIGLPTECGEYLIAYEEPNGGISYGWATWDNKAWDINFSDFQQGDEILAWHNKFEVYIR